MSLYGNKDQSNNAPNIHIGMQMLSNIANVAGLKVNARALFANTLANAFHSNLTVTCVGVNGMEKLRYANVANAQAGSGYAINDLLTLTNTGANAAVNADVKVIRLQLSNITGIKQPGGGYANGDLINIAGTGVRATARVNVGDLIVGNVVLVTLVSAGLYSANFAATTNVATSNVTGAGNACSVNIAAGPGLLQINNSGGYLGRPTTTTLNPLVGGSGTLANANLIFQTNASISGGAGWVLRTVQENGQTQYEILVAQGSIANTGAVDTGVW